MEIWKDIPGYEGLYQASDLGRIKSLEKKTNNQYGCERIMMLNPDTAGYLQAGLTKNKKRTNYKVHALVFATFSDIQKTRLTDRIDHKNEIKIDNRATNLQLLSHRQNIVKSLPKRELPTGVYHGKNGRYRAVISINSEYCSLGTYDTITEAEAQYLNAVKKTEDDNN